MFLISIAYMNKSRVFIGLTNTANISLTLAEALKLINVKADYVSLKFARRIFNYERDKLIFQFKENTFPILFNKNITSIINTALLYMYFLYYLVKYNTFIFISPSSFLPNYNDLPILKLFNKKIIFIFAGCPERDVNFDKDNQEYICNLCTDKEKQKLCYCNNIERKSLRVQYFEKYSDYIISQDDSSGYLLIKKPIWPYVIAKEPNVKNYLLKYQEEVITIVHLPSNPMMKRSHIIVPVLEEIAKDRNNIKVIVKENVPHNQLLLLLEEAHILVDALGLSYGVLAAEAMARGCIVVCGEMEFVNRRLGENPLIQVTSKNLYEVLVNLIENRPRMQFLASKSIEFYKKFHSPKSAGQYYKEKLKL